MAPAQSVLTNHRLRNWLALGALGLARAVAGAPADKPVEPFSFAVVADPHLMEKARAGTEAQGTHVERFFRCLSAMEALEGVENPEFVLVVGDIHPEELARQRDKVRLPLHVVAGNHETPARRKQLRQMFPDDFQINGRPADYYSFVHKGVRFIGLCDAGSGGDHVGHLCSEDITPPGQCEWLEKEMAAPEATKILFGHIPPHPDGGDQNMYLARNDSRFLQRLVAEKGATAMFFGHQHQATREYPVGPARCFVVRSCAWNSGNAPLGFLLVTVKPDALTTRDVIVGE